MKLQTAIDRVTLSKAEEMAKIFAGKTDIITAQGVEKATIEQNINNVIKKWIY